MGLSSVSDIAMKASRCFRSGDAYFALNNAFCDGVEISLGKASAADAIRSKSLLADLL